MRVAVTIPAYNEEKTIGSVIEKTKSAMSGLPHKFRIFVVDDGSTDGTAKAARKAGADVFSHPYNYGLAETYRTEIKNALKYKPDVIVHIDADGQYIPDEIGKLLEPIIKKKADLVLGSRFMGSIEHMPLTKRLGNKAFSYTISKIIRLKVTDCQTGFRAFTRRFAEEVSIISTHTYTQEMIIRCVKDKFRIAEVPVHFAKRREGESKLISSPFGYAARAWINILRIYRDYEPLKFFGVIGTVLFTLGTLIGFYFLYLQAIGRGVVGHQGLSMLMLMLIFSGLQIILFGFLADKDNKRNSGL
jgi:glycosyltransferase involved in cell wall biosynthesis